MKTEYLLNPNSQLNIWIAILGACALFLIAFLIAHLHNYVKNIKQKAARSTDKKKGQSTLKGILTTAGIMVVFTSCIFAINLTAW